MSSSTPTDSAAAPVLAPASQSTVLVTGAAGDLGRAIADALMRSGHHVSALDRNEEALELATREWEQAGLDGQFTTHVADQTDRAQVEVAVQAAAASRTITGLVANAGYVKFGGFLDMPASVWDRHVDVNLTGTFHVCQVAAQHMARSQQGGWITVISSNLALVHADRTSAYCATKAALLSLVRSSSAELGVHRIRVNALLPGVIETAMTRFMLDAPHVRDGLLADTPLGRLGETADVTDAVLFLASDSAAWVTGAELVIDGGQSTYGAPAWMQQIRTTPHAPTWRGRYGHI